jgi:hypothetical protein
MPAVKTHEHTTLDHQLQIQEWAIAATMPLGVRSRFGNKSETPRNQQPIQQQKLAMGDSVTKAVNRPVPSFTATGTRDGETPGMELENRGV